MKINIRCVYGGGCRRFCIIYKVTCNFLGQFYVGDTQNTLKTMEQHFQDVSQKVENDYNSGSFAAHFAKHFTQNQSHNNFEK